MKGIEDGGVSIAASEIIARNPPLQSADPKVCGLQEPRQAGLLLRHDFALLLDRLRDTAAVQASVESGDRLQARLHGRDIEGKYRARNKGMQILLSNSQAGPGRTVKQEQEEISRNHVQAFIPASVVGDSYYCSKCVAQRGA